MDLSKYKLKSMDELEQYKAVNEESFFEFYLSVVRMLNLLSEEEKFYIPDRCEESSLDLFVKFVCFYIWEEMTYTDVYAGRIDLSEDCCWVSRGRRFIPSNPVKHFYSNKQNKG